MVCWSRVMELILFTVGTIRQPQQILTWGMDLTLKRLGSRNLAVREDASDDALESDAE